MNGAIFFYAFDALMVLNDSFFDILVWKRYFTHFPADPKR